MSCVRARPGFSAARAVILALSFCLPAVAAPSEADRARARALMDQGDELVEKQRLADALPKYQEAHALMGVTTTGIEVARVLEKLGRLVEARRIAAEVAAIPAVVGEPQPFADARAAAAALLAKLDARIPTVVIRLRGAGDEVALSVDGRPVPASAAGTPRQLDPGSHRIEATARGQTATAEVQLAEGAHETVSLELGSAPAPATKAPPATSEGHGPTLGYVIGGIGLAGLATAAVTGGLIVSRDQKIKDNCPNKHCNAEGEDLVSGSRTLLAINAVAFGVGIVGTGVGAYLVVTSSKSGETAITPRVGQHSMSLAWSGTF